MLKQSKLYMILTNKDEEKCILLTPDFPYKNKPNNPEIVYDGKEHAILYRDQENTIILDYINKTEQKPLSSLKNILIVEYDTKTKKEIYEYIAKINIVTKIPNINTEIEIKPT